MFARGIASAALALALTACGRLGFDPSSVAPDATCTLTVSPSPARVNLNSSLTLTADGGTPGYSFDFGAADGNGGVALDMATGELRGGSEPGTTIVEVSDATGCKAFVDVVVGGDTLWFAGGSTGGVPSREVWSTSDGLAWSLAGQLPQARTNGALVTFRDQLLYIAGSNAAPVSTVYASPDGVTWTMIGSLPMPASNFGFAVHKDELIVVGGNGNAANVYASSDGAAWSQRGVLPDPNHGGSLVSIDGTMWYVGGHDGGLYDWVLSSPTGSAWTPAGTIPLAREYHSAVAVQGAIWIVGGQDTTPTRLADVSVSTNGTAWTSVAPLPVARAFSPLVKFLGRMWSLGGSDLGGVVSTDGTSWIAHTTTFPQPRQGGAAAVFTPR